MGTVVTRYLQNQESNDKPDSKQLSNGTVDLSAITKAPVASTGKCDLHL